MGCICSKGIPSEQAKVHREKGPGKLSRRFVASSRRDEVVIVDADGTIATDGATTRLISKSHEDTVTPLPPLTSCEVEKKATAVVVGDAPQLTKKGSGHQRQASVETGGSEVEPKLRIARVPNGFEAEHVAAGWPSWFVSVAGEAIKGWLPRRSDSFETMIKIGQGTYSSVYKARDLETGKIVALKKVRFASGDPESVRFMAREIHVLRRLDHPNIVKLQGLVASKMSSGISLVFEYAEHDLAGLAATSGIKFSEAQIKCYMQQLLNGLDYCHSHGVLHRDIKGSNLLIDNNGILRIADFGLATFFNPDRKQPLTSRVVTLWYRPPELLLGSTEYSVAVDLWSTGCILAELLAGKPIMPGRTEVEQLHKIFKLCGSPSEEYWRKSKLPHATVFKPQHPYRRCVREAFKDFPSYALDLLDVILAIEPENRGTAASALKSEFFTTKPFACDPSTLPKYPPSKEFDAKLRDEEARRQRAAAVKGHGSESMRGGLREPKAMRVPDAKMELERKLAQSNKKGSSEKYNPLEDGESGIPVDPAMGTVQNGSSWCKKVREEEHRAVPDRSLSSARGLNGVDFRMQRPYIPQVGGGDLSQLSGLVAARTSARLENHRDRSDRPHWPEHRYRCNQPDVAEASDKQDWTHQLLERPTSSHKKDVKEPTPVYNTKKNRIHYSGPLMPPGGNLEEMLKEHERQIQQAVRKARLDKAHTRRIYG